MKEGLMQVAVDAVVFSVMHNELNILLIKRRKPPFKGRFALPGGFVKANEELEEAVKRELFEETGVKNIFLKQIGAYGGVRRDPRGRVVSVTYIALISADQELKARADASEARWHRIDNLPELAFDHRRIIDDALKQLRYEIQTTNVAFQILPEKFTLTQLQQLYESILNKKLDKRNFRKRIKELNILKETKETMMEGAHRPARLYIFKERGYTPIKERIQVFI